MRESDAKMRQVVNARREGAMQEIYPSPWMRCCTQVRVGDVRRSELLVVDYTQLRVIASHALRRMRTLGPRPVLVDRARHRRRYSPAPTWVVRRARWRALARRVARL